FWNILQVCEVGELSEIFQWKGEVPSGLPDWKEEEKQHLGEELSDVLLYLVRLADICGIDLDKAVLRKLELNGKKYPVKLCKGSKLVESKMILSYLRMMLTHNLVLSRNKDLVELLNFGIGVHHVGMLRFDKGLTERLLSDGLLKVLVCAAAVAWGVNLPAYTLYFKNGKKGNLVLNRRLRSSWLSIFERSETALSVFESLKRKLSDQVAIG
uniref:Uncharacterized protein n=1 Tax=Cucumis melo TaxID=3656 RepID=A0A9I9DI62_CUCME